MLNEDANFVKYAVHTASLPNEQEHSLEMTPIGEDTNWRYVEDEGLEGSRPCRIPRTEGDLRWDLTNYFDTLRRHSEKVIVLSGSDRRILQHGGSRNFAIGV